MEQIVLDAKMRDGLGKGNSRKYRREELIPAVIYGRDMEPLTLTLARRDLAKVLVKGATHKLINLQIENNGSSTQKLCMIQEMQRDTFQKRVLHVDFHQVSLTEKITATIPVKLVGDAKGVKNGGILDHVLWTVEVEALPTELPEEIVINVTDLEVGHSVHVKEIPTSQDVKILTSPDDVVVVVHPPKVEATPAAAEPGATPAQPEVVGKGVKTEEESAPAKGEKEKK